MTGHRWGDPDEVVLEALGVLDSFLDLIGGLDSSWVLLWSKSTEMRKPE